MDTIKELRKALTFDFDLMLNNVMEKSSVKKILIELNQDEQLSEGVDAKDQRIRTISSEEFKTGGVYSFQSISERSKRGLQTDKVDLKFTGKFWKTFRVNRKGDDWEIIADWTIHGEDIRSHFKTKYDFLGLTPTNLDYFAFNTLLPELEKEFKRMYNYRLIDLLKNWGVIDEVNIINKLI